MVRNTTMLYVMNIVKMILPLFTLPYLTRVLSVDCYGVVAYVKSCITYMQLTVDFGFLLSSTKEIVKARNDPTRIGQVVGDTLAAKMLLSAAALAVLLGMTAAIPLCGRTWRIPCSPSPWCFCPAFWWIFCSAVWNRCR